MINIRIPKDSLSSDLSMMPEDTYTAELDKITTKISKNSGQPVTWVAWTITSDPAEPINEDEYPDLQGSTVGKKVLESYSLQEQAVWRLNTLFKLATQENLPTDQDFSLEEFNSMLEERLVGFEATLVLVQDEDDKGNGVMRVDSCVPTQKKKRRKK